MSDFTPVFRLTETAFRALLNEANNNPNLWLDPEADFTKVLETNGITEYREHTDVVAQGSIRLELPADRQRPLADRQALRFHKNLKGMTPARASDPNLLAWINHFVLHPYGIARWPRRENSNATNHVKRHWLTEATQDIWESSISGRTWWIAETCLRAARVSDGSFNAQQALELFTESAERYHQCMLFSFLRNPHLTSEYIKALLAEAQGINNRGLMHWIRQINCQAGALLIDALNAEQCRQLVVNAVEQTMTDEKHVIDRKYLKGIKPSAVSGIP